MAGLHTEPFVAVDQYGDSKPAKIQICECGGREWYIFTILVAGRWHPHMQCVACDDVYCDGTCSGAEPADRPDRNGGDHCGQHI